MRHDKPWGTHLEKPVPAVVAEVIELGAEAVIWLRPASIQNAQLQMRLPTRAVHRHAVVPGTAVTVCLRAADIIPSGEEPEWAGL